MQSYIILFIIGKQYLTGKHNNSHCVVLAHQILKPHHKNGYMLTNILLIIRYNTTSYKKPTTATTQIFKIYNYMRTEKPQKRKMQRHLLVTHKKVGISRALLYSCRDTTSVKFYHVQDLQYCHENIARQGHTSSGIVKGCYIM